MLQKSLDFIEFFAFLRQIGLSGTQRSAQPVEFLLQRGTLPFKRLNLALCMAQRREFATGIGGGVPVLDECLLFQIVRLFALFHFVGKDTLLVGQFLFIVGFLVEPIGHFLGSVVLLLLLGGFFLEIGDFIVDLGLFFLVEEPDVLQLVVKQVPLMLLRLADVVNLFADLCIDLGAGHLLEQGGLVVVVTLQELGKLALGQHNGAEELVHVQPYGLLDKIIDFFDFGVLAGLGNTLVGLDGADGLLDSAVGLVAGAVYVPGGNVGSAVVVIKGEPHVGAHGPAAQELAHIVGLEVILVGALLTAGGVVGTLGGIQTRCVAIQGQAQAVDDGGFARARLAGDEEQVFVGQRCGVKVDFGVLDRRDIVDNELLEFHSLLSFSTSW